ncbi:MAG: zf-HC2 domain-containing protein [Roseiflexus sp.]|nr:zf-HC2 domain-containing protein [Roseiflexus sp.]
MTTQPPQLNDRDLELISAYIDGQLSAEERREVERRLDDEADLRLAYEELRATVQVLRDLEPVRPPRSLTLDPANVALQRPPATRLGWGRLLQVAGVFAAVLVAAIGTLSVIGSLGSGAPASAPMVAAPTTAPASPLELRESAPTPERSDIAAAPATLDDGSGPVAPQAHATVVATEVAALPDVAPQPTIVTTPAISSPGTVDLARPKPPADSTPPATPPDLTLLLTLAVVALAAGGVLLWRRRKG